MNPKISIIVPVYNLASYLPNCLDSLLGQTYKNVEVLVVNDGSTDGSWKLIQDYAKRDGRVVAINQPNGGAAKARNHALDMITGELLTFVDGDDMLSPDTLELLLKKFEDSELDWVEFPVVRVDANGKELNKAKAYSDFYPSNDEILQRDEFVAYYASHRLSELACACLYRYSSVKNLRFPEGYYYEDSFYFTDVVATTHKGALSMSGRYLYVERENSSQLIKSTGKHLYSRVCCYLDRRLKFLKLSPQYKKWFQEQDLDLWYYLRIQKAKKIEGADDALNLLQSKVSIKKRSDLRKEIKILVYTLVGYGNIVKLATLLGRK